MIGGRLRAVRAILRLAWGAGGPGLAALLLVTVAAGLLPVASAWLVKLLLDVLTGAQSGVALGTVLAGLAAVTAVGQLLPAWEEYWRAELQRRMAFRITDLLTRKVNGFQGLGAFEDPAFHDDLRLAQDGGRSAPLQVVYLGMTLVQQLVTVVGFVAVLVAVSPMLAALVALAALPALVGELRLSRRRVRLATTLSPTERRRFFYELLQTDVRAAKEIRLFDLGAHLHGRMLRELRSIDAAERGLDRSALRLQLGLGAVTVAVMVVALVDVIGRVSAGTVSAGDVTVLLAALAGVQGSAASAVAATAGLAEALLMFGHFDRFLALPPDLPAPPGPATEPSALRTGIEFRDVWFRYSDQHPWVLRGLDLRIGAGEALALVGANGAGKTTLVKLLCRLYDPQRGQILWDGVDLRDVDVTGLRRRIAAVFQDHMQYELTAAENVGLGDVRHLGDRGRIEQAAHLAGVDDDLAGLPHGYDTLLTHLFDDHQSEEGPGGLVLSGGQWQKVALARMLLRRDADVLLLDEPSSALDADAEYDILMRFRDLLEERTALLISHRLNTVRLADRIAVVEGGTIAELGTHAELMAAGGTYARMFSRQAQSFA